MFGIMNYNGTTVLCHTFRGDDTFIMKRWDGSAVPVMRESQFEIDKLLQLMWEVTHDYTLVVFEFTKEQEENLVFKKLRRKG